MNNTQGIQENRTDAYEKRAMYAQKGVVYKGDMTYAATGNAYSAYRIQRAYDEKQYNMKIDQLRDQRDKMNSFGFRFKNFITTGLTGANEGFNTGMQIGTSSGYWWNSVGGK